MTRPLVSVVMPVYNAEQYLNKSIESILDQTYTNFEFIIVNDGSTDTSESVIRSYNDKRIRLVSRPNKGVSASRNEAIAISKGRFIAMQDADDISEKDRFHKQIEFLEKNSDVGFVGTNYHVIGPNDEEIMFTTDVFTHPKDLKLAEVFFNQFGQGTVMLRKSSIEDLKYNPESRLAEDYDLWTKLLRITDAANLAEPLYRWRMHESSASGQNTEEIKHAAYKIRDREFDYYLNHKNEYPLLSFHLSSTRGGPKRYMELRSGLLRNMALMYCYKGLRKLAISVLFLAILHAPWLKKTYSQLFTTLFQKKNIKDIQYEFL